MEQISLASDSFSICMDQLCRRVGMRVYNRYDTQDKVRSKYVKKVNWFSIHCVSQTLQAKYIPNIHWKTFQALDRNKVKKEL